MEEEEGGGRDRYMFKSYGPVIQVQDILLGEGLCVIFTYPIKPRKSCIPVGSEGHHIAFHLICQEGRTMSMPG